MYKKENCLYFEARFVSNLLFDNLISDSINLFLFILMDMKCLNA